MNKKLPWGDDFWLTEESAWGSYLLVNELPEEMIVEAAFENLVLGQCYCQQRRRLQRR